SQQFDYMHWLLPAIFMRNTVRELDHATRATGHHIIGAGFHDLLNLVIIDLARQVIVKEAETAAEAATTIRLLHFHHLYTRNRIDKLARLIFDFQIAHKMEGIMVGHLAIHFALRRRYL